MQADNRMRAWYEPNMLNGLLYACKLGEIRPDCPCSLVKRDTEGKLEVIPNDGQEPAERELVSFRALLSGYRDAQCLQVMAA